MENATVISELQHVLIAQLGDPDCSFSIGAFGAVAEFFRRDDENVSTIEGVPLTVVTKRGALRIALREDILPIAYETVSSSENRWMHGIALCLSSHAGKTTARNSITELGHDVDAIRPSDRHDILFDLGLGTINVEFCIRTGDRELISKLHRSAGESILGADNDVMRTIIEASPHRVVSSGLGRVEVFQAIGQHKTPEGPHTHVLPKLLRSGRSHDAKIPIPRGYLPCLNIYPASPLFETLGQPRTYDPERHLAFSALLDKWGPNEYVAQKQSVTRSIRGDVEPAAFPAPVTRLQRSAVRIALRQLAYDNTLNDRVSRWREYFDRN